MHGRLKVRSSEEQEAAKKKERQRKAQHYMAIMKKILDKRASNERDDESLQLTRDILSVNPEITLLWNYRREILLERQASMSESEFTELCQSELSLCENCLRVNPKAYCVWLARQWVLLHSPHTDWVREKALCDKFLVYDERNFHCWDHRRFVINQSQCVSAIDEFSFTYDKIATNFSNYSAWHYRSKLLPQVAPSNDNNSSVTQEALLKEHELTLNAFFTDPDDQSAWFYHRWLLGEVTPPDSVDLVYVQPHPRPRLFIAFNQPVQIDHRLSLSVDGEHCPLTHSAEEGGWPTLLYHSPLPHLPVSLSLSFDQQTISLSGDDKLWVRRDGMLPWATTQAPPSLLQSQLDSCEELLTEEPSNKWCLLTTVLLMHALDPPSYSITIRERTAELYRVDPLRKSYYTDLLSGIMMKSALRSSFLTISSSSPGQLTLDLSNKALTRLEATQYLLPYQRLDLSNNSLKSLPSSLVCPSLTALVLDNNLLEILPLISAPLLETLSLKNNNITELKCIEDTLSGLPSLHVLCVQGNPLCEQGNLPLKDLRVMAPGLHEFNGQSLVNTD